jgi:hypothetical protein
MKTLEGNSVNMIHDADILKENIHEQTNLAITQCIGKTNTNLDEIITRYADTINN